MTTKILDDGTKWVKAQYWDETPLKGIYIASYKIDGIRCIRGKDGLVYSRKSEPIKHHLERFSFTDAEFFVKDWNTTASMLNSDKTPDEAFKQEMFYELSPDFLDGRLTIGKVVDPTIETINALLKQALELKYEGIVLREVARNNWIKVVPEKFADVRITDITEGNGKNAGMAGAIVTDYGNVGSFKTQNGMSDAELRTELWKNKKKYIGSIIQVGYRELTVNKKFRFARLARLRPDKNYEDLPN